MHRWTWATGILLAAAASPAAAITCEESGGTPGRETRVSITIESPSDGALVAASSGCGGVVVVTGKYEVEAPPLLYDFYIVIDASGSATRDSGADVDGDGILGEADDTIYQAEIRAAQDFIRALHPASSRAAVIVFNRNATLRQALTADLAAAIATLDAMRADNPRWGTGYVPAMEAVRLEMLARGDLAGRLQRCVFLSDGQPDETLAQTDAKAAELAALGLVIDTFALGFPDSESLRGMASVSGGRFTALARPGDIVALLPDFVPDVARVFDSVEEVSGEAGTVTTDEATRSFEAVVPLRPGLNRVTLTLSAGDPAVVVTCSIELMMSEALIADAGPAAGACAGGGAVRLDGAASFAACPTPVYRWLDCAGSVIADWSESPILDVAPCELACEDVMLEIACPGEPCVARAITQASCLLAPEPAPALVSACGLAVRLGCGLADPALEHAWDLDPATDADGDGDPANDPDVAGCDVEHEFADPGRHEVVARSLDPATACESSAWLSFTLREHASPRPLDGGICPGAPAAFSCGTPDPGATYWWDLDAASDTDFDGDPGNDPDAFGCDVAHSWPSEGRRRVHGWIADASGCVRLVAAGVLDVAAGATPGEVQDLRVARRGDMLDFSWAGVPGASAHRLLRGSLQALHETHAYDHAADDGTGRGACEIRGIDSFTDIDDAWGSEAFYYLVTAMNGCGGEGGAGFAFDGRQRIPRPERLPTGSCP